MGWVARRMHGGLYLGLNLATAGLLVVALGVVEPVSGRAISGRTDLGQQDLAIAPASAEAQIEQHLHLAQAAQRHGNDTQALDQLGQALSLVIALPDLEARDRWLQCLGDRFLALDAPDRAQAAAQAMSYDTIGNGDLRRATLERAIIRAYLIDGQRVAATDLIAAAPEGIQELYWQTGIEALAQHGQVAQALELLPNIQDAYFQIQARRAIHQAYLGVENFGAARRLWSESSVAATERDTELADIALWMARASQFEAAHAVTQEMASPQRVSTLMELAQMQRANGQPQVAIALLDEAAQHVVSDDLWWPTLERALALAKLYEALEQPDAARQILAQAEDLPGVREDPSAVLAWISAYGRIGAFDQAGALMEGVSQDQRPEARFRLASAYADRRQYDQAITLASQIPDGVLFPLPEYPDPKVELLQRIITEATQADQFMVARRAAQVMQSPVDQARAWTAIAQAHQQRNQAAEVIAALDQALAVATTIDRYGVYVDRHTYIELSNASLLIPIAEGYWTAGQSPTAIATAETALRSLQAFQSNATTLWFQSQSLEAIAGLGQRWQQPSLHRAAVVALETQINQAPAPSEAVLIDDLIRLVRLTYNPDQPTDPIFQRSLARLDALAHQSSSPEQQLKLLQTLLYVYRNNHSPQRVRPTLDRVLQVISAQNDYMRDDLYAQLALAIAPAQDVTLVAEPLAHIESPSRRAEALMQIARQWAASNDSGQAMDYFDQALALAESRLTRQELDYVLAATAIAYSQTALNQNYDPQLTPTEVELILRLPTHSPDALEQSRLWISLIPALPAQAQSRAYAALATSLAASPTFNRRYLLWEAITEHLTHQRFDTATEWANLLDAPYGAIARQRIQIAR